ncbi:MAG: XdhC family protein, partial [Calditrichaeota bacterium]|nr:XdhC family protein [Calditrichota bacterium]
MNIFEEIIRAKNKGEYAVLATVVDSKGSAPRTAGARMLIKKDGTILGSIGGGAVEKAVVDEAKEIAGTEQTKLLAYDLGKDLSMSCGGRMTIFLDPLTPPSQLIIFGAGHIGTALVQLGKLLDFHVTVIDNRSEFVNTDRLPFADQLIVGDYQDILPELKFHQETFIVLVTHRHAYDQKILEYCIQQPFKYLGMIGSKTKVA